MGRQNRQQNRILHEGILIPTDIKKSLTDYILDESSQIKETLDELEADVKDSILDEQKMMLTVQTDKGTMKLFMEDSIKKEINNFMLKL